MASRKSKPARSTTVKPATEKRAPRKTSAAGAVRGSARTKVTPRPPEPTCEEIALCAYGIWEREGRPAGRDAEHWLLAEALLRQSRIET
jgi:hypothetical protein